jgi:two-component system, OmpR family, response regulator AdeR
MIDPAPPRSAPGERLVLIVEDEATLAETIELYLRHDGYRTERASDGARALALFRAAHPDLVLLDLGLPTIDGLEVLRRIRATSTVPVVILTARAEEVDELLGLGMGADDYLTKPVSARKLLARVAVALRRAATRDDPQSAPIRIGDLEVDAYRALVRYRGHPLDLTPSEYAILHHMARTPGRVIDRAELYEAAIPDGDALERAVDVHVVALRRKLRTAGADPDPIRTVRGRGYQLLDRR